VRCRPPFPGFHASEVRFLKCGYSTMIKNACFRMMRIILILIRNGTEFSQLRSHLYLRPYDCIYEIQICQIRYFMPHTASSSAPFLERGVRYAAVESPSPFFRICVPSRIHREGVPILLQNGFSRSSTGAFSCTDSQKSQLFLAIIFTQSIPSK
jgi:hypothetical protein